MLLCRAPGSREHLFVRANHTFPLGMIRMDDFLEVLAKVRQGSAIQILNQAQYPGDARALSYLPAVMHVGKY